MITDQELDELQTQYDKSTPGEWWGERLGAPFMDGTQTQLIRVKGQPGIRMHAKCMVYDAEFIVAAHREVPRLIEEIRRLRGDAK